MWCLLIVFRNKSKKMVAERQKQTALPGRRAPSAHFFRASRLPRVSLPLGRAVFKHVLLFHFLTFPW